MKKSVFGRSLCQFKRITFAVSLIQFGYGIPKNPACYTELYMESRAETLKVKMVPKFNVTSWQQCKLLMLFSHGNFPLLLGGSVLESCGGYYEFISKDTRGIQFVQV